MNKHAYLIMAHNNYEQLSFLVSVLDDFRNDIFIHIDKRAFFSENDKNKIIQNCKKSKIYFTERIATYWGGESLIWAELLLLKTAYQTQKYHFYHLLSGADLPLATQDEIHNFFNNTSYNLFLSLASVQGHRENINRIKYYHFFEHFTPKTIPIAGKYFFTFYRECEVLFQKLIGVNRLKKYNIEPIKATQWFSASHQIIEFLLEKEEEIREIFKNSFLCDEVFIPLILKKYGKLNNNAPEGCLRYIDWERGAPFTFINSDDTILMTARENGHFFARKFDLKNTENLFNFFRKIHNK